MITNESIYICPAVIMYDNCDFIVMKKTRIYFNYCCIAIVSAAITYGLTRLCQPEVCVKTVVVEKVVPAIENSVFEDELESIMLEAFLDDWGPV